jgi:uncharacterized protein Yka (UPF0111/DUF47 family)
MLSFIGNLFVSKDKIFFDLLDEVAENNDKMGAKLLEMIKSNSPEYQSSWLEKIQLREEENKTLTRRLLSEMDRNFLTPFDREDMHGITKSLEFVGHFICGAAKKINFYRVDTSDKGLNALSSCIKQSTEALRGAVNEIRTLKNINAIMEACIKVNTVENEADDAYDIAIEQLFQNENDIKEVIKRREIYQIMELVCDQCENAAEVIEGIVIKST